MHTTHTLARLSAATLLAGAAACGPFHRGGSSNAYIEFVNQSIDQVDVYAVPVAGDQMRLGTVDGGRTQRLQVPPTAIGGDGMTNIVARVFANSRAPRTGRIALGPGEAVQVTLPTTENTLNVLPVTR
jgi:hypothetical protein